MPSSTRWSKLAAGLLLAAWLFHLWRAAVAGITTDEAFTALHFVGRPWLELMTSYDANHHVLHTVLCKLSVGAFGWSAPALRLPALLGTALFFAGLWRLLRRAVGDSPVLAAGCLAIMWWPEMVDYLSLARGYSLALGFFTAGLVEAWEERYQRCSALLGLAVASNLVFALPVAAVVISLTVGRRLWGRLDELAAPGAVVAFVVVSLPLSRATAGHFYFGAASWRESLESLLRMPGPEWGTDAAVFVAPAAMLWAAWRQRDWLAGAWVFCVAATGLAHSMFGTPLPAGRTGLHLLLLGLILVVSAARKWKWSAAGLAALGVCCAVSVDPLVYREARFDADQREVLAAIVRENPRALVACTHPLNNVLEFYMRVQRVPAPPPVLNTPGVPAEIYMLEEGKEAPPAGTRLLARFPRSGVALYAR